MDEMNSANQPASMHNILNANPATPTVPNQSAALWYAAASAADLPAIHIPQHREPAAQEIRPAPECPKRPPSTPLDQRQPEAVLADPVVIEKDVVFQMGGLPYADLCKERARERFKEMKKQEHMSNGDFERMKRRKKGDTSMSAREKYLRRLRMNQDSAAAARYAQEVYVQVLEKLVKTAEAEKNGMRLEIAQMREEKSMLHTRVAQLEEAVEHTKKESQCLQEVTRNTEAFHVAKLVDLFTQPEAVSVAGQANDPNLLADCIQLTRAS